MTPQEIGLLVLKIQDDDVLPSHMRTFIKAVMMDEEVRRNAKLVASLSGLPEETRIKHCLANVMVLMTSTPLGPDVPPSDKGWRKTTKLFGEKFFVCFTGPWKEHVRSLDALTAQEFQKRLRALGTKRSKNMPELEVSEVLGGHIVVLEDFWGVRGTFIA